MPSIIAYLVFFSWPLVVFLIFRKLDLVPAIVWSMLVGFLMLPLRVEIDLPALPTISKYELTSLMVAIMAFVKLREAEQARQWAANASGVPVAPSAPPARKSKMRLVTNIMLAIVIITPLMTVMNNSDPIFAGPTYIPGLRVYDALSMIGGKAFVLLPFFVGRRFLTTPESHVVILRVLVLSLMAYTVLGFYEVRMSPQLNRMFYGFFPHSFLQHIRAGGFRPLVFLSHGLILGIFMTLAILSAAAMWRHAKSVGESSFFGRSARFGC
uniref:Uncharacterized protein n=1 Tax=Yoonia rhodophyticola TaxID=3137370 RepID=A0AAN0NLL1_9RHOB